MNVEARNELMAVLADISSLVPFIRLGQLVCNLTDMADTTYHNPVWDVEDEELLTVAKEHLAALRRLPPESIAEQIRSHLESDQYARSAAG